MLKTLESENWEPDIIDLNDWIFKYHPDVYADTKYLSNPYSLWLMFWIEQGKPTSILD